MTENLDIQADGRTAVSGRDQEEWQEETTQNKADEPPASLQRVIIEKTDKQIQPSWSKTSIGCNVKVKKKTDESVQISQTNSSALNIN